MENVGAKFYELTVEERRKKYSMSARNSSYWLQVVARSHSDLSLQATTPIESPPVETLRSSSWKTVESQDTIDEPSCASVDEVVFEHQRVPACAGLGYTYTLTSTALTLHDARIQGLPFASRPKEVCDSVLRSAVFQSSRRFRCRRMSATTVAGAGSGSRPGRIHVHADTDNDGSTNFSRHITLTLDALGWRYSTSFSHLRLESTACFGYHRKTTFCRRRKWVRRRLFVPLHSPSMLQPCGVGR